MSSGDFVGGFETPKKLLIHQKIEEMKSPDQGRFFVFPFEFSVLQSTQYSVRVLTNLSVTFAPAALSDRIAFPQFEL